MNLMHRATARATHGFTVIELLMVVALISIMAAVAIPRINFNRYRADAAGRLVRTQLQTAQRNALTRQANVIASFDLTDNRIRTILDLNGNDAVDAGEKVDHRRLEEGARYATPTWAGPNGSTPGAAVVGSNLRTVAGMTSVIFRRDGSASSDVEVYVTMRPAVAEEYRAITLAQSTGRSELWKWNGTAWIRMTQ